MLSYLEAIFKNLRDESKTVDVLINNAALQPVAAIADLTALGVQEILSVNLRAPMMLTRDFARASGLGGSVVNICSIEALSPAKAHSHYAATKAGLLHFTRAAALELGPQKIRVNAICPGLINREGLRGGAIEQPTEHRGAVLRPRAGKGKARLKHGRLQEGQRHRRQSPLLSLRPLTLPWWLL